MYYKKEKNVLVLGLNYDQLKYIKEVKKLGYKIYGVDKNKLAPGRKYCDFYLKSSYTKTKNILKFLNSKKFPKNSYFFTAASQIAFLSISKIANSLNENFIDQSIIDSCIDKSKMNKLFFKNKIPTPKTKIVYKKKNVKIDKSKEYFLKSDYGKSPLYCFHIKNGEIPNFPSKDDFFKKCFLLQEKIFGEHYRINYIKNKFFFFKKIDERTSYPIELKNKFSKIIKKKIVTFINLNKLKNFLIKFDLIINKDNWYIIDIGFDPPKRLENLAVYLGNNFYKSYVYNWLEGKDIFLNYKSNSFKNLIIKIRKNGKTKIIKN